jgi:hypothetical protein
VVSLIKSLATVTDLAYAKAAKDFEKAHEINSFSTQFILEWQEVKSVSRANFPATDGPPGEQDF